MENKNTNFDILELLEIEEEQKDLFQENSSNGLKDTSLLCEEKNNDPLGSYESCIDVSEDTTKEITPTQISTPEDHIQDLLAELSGQENQAETVINTKDTKPSYLQKIYQSIIFLVKYLTTSSIIFMILLSITNYSAYIEIARSYLNPAILEQNRNALLSSINGAEMIGSGSNNLEKESNIEKFSQVKNKTFHSMDKLLNDSYDENLNMQIDITPYENRVIIPKIGKNIPLLEVKDKKVQNVKELEDAFMSELSNGIIRYPGSAKPGENGNTFIFGHSSNFPWIKGEYNDVFALLDNLVFGDEVIVYYGQKKFVYKIKEKKIIKPGDVSVLKRTTGKAEISLMTCWPVGTTLNRMIVVGELVK